MKTKLMAMLLAAGAALGAWMTVCAFKNSFGTSKSL